MLYYSSKAIYARVIRQLVNQFRIEKNKKINTIVTKKVYKVVDKIVNKKDL